MVTELEESRDLTRVIVHVDMDAFYAAVEMRDCPELKDKPMAVGSMSMLVSLNPKTDQPYYNNVLDEPIMHIKWNIFLFWGTLGKNQDLIEM